MLKARSALSVAESSPRLDSDFLRFSDWKTPACIQRTAARFRFFKKRRRASLRARSEERREYEETVRLRDVELDEVATIFRGYGLQGAVLDQVTKAIASDQKRWVDFMMRFELGLERPDPRRAPVSAFTIAISYVVGGLIPLIPYMMGLQIDRALVFSVVFTGIALAIFGAVKGRLTGINMVKSAVQTVFVGGLAAGAAFYLASLLAR
jgi:vacuolar iron transporter family protein